MNLPKLTILCACIVLTVSFMMPVPSAMAFTSTHQFTLNDVMGGFDGSTFGNDVSPVPTTILCGAPGATQCPCGPRVGGKCSLPQPFTDKGGDILYPVDSDFGFHTIDFLGALEKVRDGIYTEGFVGVARDETGQGIGVKISNAKTDTYKVKAPMGTWCRGLGGNSVKCETEHYTVMEHILSCHEVIPYFYVPDPSMGPPAGQQAITFPGGPDSFDCGEAGLDDMALVMTGGTLGARLVDATPCETAIGAPSGCQMFANDKTDMKNDVALTNDYSIQLKDDGKPLYGWGTLHKRPNDVRLYARMDLPPEWTAPGAPDFPVTSALLVINHWITNNPNDQLRPEDLENEAATGRKPSYEIDSAGRWKSLVPCYEGDGDIIDNEFGTIDPDAIGAGTILKNPAFSFTGYRVEHDLYALSGDLREGLTNAWYTSLNRDPFEWSYDRNPDPNVQDFVGSPIPDDRLGTLVSGPRWRLKPNKFGQDLPGLEIPLRECSPPPFQHDNIKYVVGKPTTTVINLLDWEDEHSPLRSSRGWVDYRANPFITVDPATGVSSNGLPMTDGFDLAVYIKGDRKPTAVYSATLMINEDSSPPVGEAEVAISKLKVPRKTFTGSVRKSLLKITNDDTALATAAGIVVVSNDVQGKVFSASFVGLSPGKTQKIDFSWTAPNVRTTVNWNASVYVGGALVDTETGMATIVR